MAYFIQNMTFIKNFHRQLHVKEDRRKISTLKHHDNYGFLSDFATWFQKFHFFS